MFSWKKVDWLKPKMLAPALLVLVFLQGIGVPVFTYALFPLGDLTVTVGVVLSVALAAGIYLDGRR